MMLIMNSEASDYESQETESQVYDEVDDEDEYETKDDPTEDSPDLILMKTIKKTPKNLLIQMMKPMLELSRELRKREMADRLSILSGLVDRDYTNCFYPGSLGLAFQNQYGDLCLLLFVAGVRSGG